MRLVLDANVVVAACLAAVNGFALFHGYVLIAPDLMWWEAASTLHEYLWRIDADRRTADMVSLEREDVLAAFERLQQAPIERFPVSDALLTESWAIADRCGFSRVYDAAYVALAAQHEAQLVTLDGNLRRSPAAKLVAMLGPADLDCSHLS